MQIDKDIPPPVPSTRAMGRHLLILEPGCSIFIPGRNSLYAAKAMQACREYMPKQAALRDFTSRQVPGGVRIWCVADRTPAPEPRAPSPWDNVRYEIDVPVPAEPSAADLLS